MYKLNVKITIIVVIGEDVHVVKQLACMEPGKLILLW